MRIIIEDIDGVFYLDLILTEDEADSMVKGKLLEGMTTVKSRRFYIGVRSGENWRHSDNFFNDFVEGDIE
jgi:hypothetical protein